MTPKAQPPRWAKIRREFHAPQIKAAPVKVVMPHALPRKPIKENP